jgi:DMSO/TMAO reductase YedYZ molybdopterin-dependent catalytic subunit
MTSVPSQPPPYGKPFQISKVIKYASAQPWNVISYGSEGKKSMKARLLLCLLLATGFGLGVGAQERVKIDSTTPYGQIIEMNPKFVDASALPLTSVESLHSTGTPQSVDLASWRLAVAGKGVTTPLALNYDELSKLPMVKKRVLLICPGFFYDYLEWEGVPLQALLEKAGVRDYARVVFTSVDGYKSDFKKAEVQTGLIMVALRDNGVPLPRAHGFPARIVAEGTYGGRWVKYLTAITLE